MKNQELYNIYKNIKKINDPMYQYISYFLAILFIILGIKQIIDYSKRKKTIVNNNSEEIQKNKELDIMHKKYIRSFVASLVLLATGFILSPRYSAHKPIIYLFLLYIII